MWERRRIGEIQGGTESRCCGPLLSGKYKRRIVRGALIRLLRITPAR
jgi:hypothetical protein